MRRRKGEYTIPATHASCDLHLKVMLHQDSAIAMTLLAKGTAMLAKPFEYSRTLSSLMNRQGVALRRLTNWHAIESVRDNLSFCVAANGA